MLLYVLIPRLRETSCVNLFTRDVIVERSEDILSYWLLLSQFLVVIWPFEVKNQES